MKGGSGEALAEWKEGRQIWGRRGERGRLRGNGTIGWRIEGKKGGRRGLRGGGRNKGEGKGGSKRVGMRGVEGMGEDRVGRG